MRKFLRKWLGIKSNSNRLELLEKSNSNLHRRLNNAQSQIKSNQSKIDRIRKNQSKH